MYKGELILIGAGPGDPDLITVKAWRTLRQADIILYDNLANPALLDIASRNCERIPVGKRPHGPTTTQEEIHEMIRKYARRQGKIVRLKGGDPFIFGRGFEEVLFAKEIGIKVTYIPGISSMQTTGLADIPLTHRAVSDGVWIITGTRKDGTLSDDLRLALRSKATVVIYMGMQQLPAISRLYRKEGYGKMPAAIIQNGSLPTERKVIGTAGELQELARNHRLSHPAIIIIGEVVSLHRQPTASLHQGPTQEKDRADSHSPSVQPEGTAETGPLHEISLVI